MPANNEPIILLVSLPPSANRIWRNNRLSPEYRAWKLSAGWEAKTQLVGIPMISGRFRVKVEIDPGRKDLDNVLKPLLDLCQSVGAIKNDKYAEEIHLYRMERDGVLIELQAL
jgi:Holliday junction resolvase RusA-like endonuclease